ncbi:hypothetical protein NDK50_22575 [Paraburkholderia bryophila]|uniref:hypothetical protein n=1 Tax=Paraburkholderia bryophila TaxID=420952 RepID=UPI00234B2547|nr:hypothetical protein [Paraburkholderia bryophila]WCM23644.1 hypothetical protein NDK50_22575 [Paraburkholderia bryophila]
MCAPVQFEGARSNCNSEGRQDASPYLAILRQEENHYPTLPFECVKCFPAEMQRLLGRSSSTIYAGFVERHVLMSDPYVLLQQVDFVEVGHFD